MSKSLEAVEYSEHGDGPAVLFVPGSFSTGSAWKGVIQAFGPGYRVVTTSLFGYGGTVDPRTETTSTIAPQVATLKAIISRVGTPVHIVTHSYGGLCVLGLALDPRIAIRSLTFIEANPFGVLRAVGEAGLLADPERMLAAYVPAFRNGTPDAVRHMVDY